VLAFWAFLSFLITIFRCPRGRRRTQPLCLLCNDKIVESDLSCHLFTLHKNDERVLSCDKCSQMFLDKTSLKTHFFRLHGEKTALLSAKFSCSLCPAKFKSASLLVQHNNLHQGLKPFKCLECPCSYPLKLSLSKHMQLKHNPDYKAKSTPPSSQCEQCGKQFKFKHSLKVHQFSHSGQNKFPCNLCEKTLSSRQTLNDHINAIHSNIKPFKCSTCFKKFVSEKVCTYQFINNP